MFGGEWYEQMKQWRRWIGRCVLTLAATLLAASFLYPMTLGGSVWGGKVEDGRYFVVATGHRYTEVSEAEWRVAQYLECAFPWLPVMLIWIGLGLWAAPVKNNEPALRPSTRHALKGLLIACGVVVGTGALAVMRCFNTGVPWTLGLGVCLALWATFFLILWSDTRSTRPRSNAEPAGCT
jgi:hypothetical protein